MLDALRCASFTVAQVPKATSEALCVSSSFTGCFQYLYAKVHPVPDAAASGQDLGREQSFEVESSRTSSASGQLQKANQGQWPGGPRASQRATSAYSGRPAAHRPASTGSGSDLDISCLVDNTPFRINEVCCNLSCPWLAAEVTL